MYNIMNEKSMDRIFTRLSDCALHPVGLSCVPGLGLAGFSPACPTVPCTRSVCPVFLD